MQLIDQLALIKLNQLGDIFQLRQTVDNKKLLDELSIFKDDWKPYNPRKKNNRYGLSVTSFDGGLSGTPDLDSLLEYNKANNTNLTNYDCTTLTDVYKKSEELQKLLSRFEPWLLRTHFIKLNTGGFFPEHRDGYEGGPQETIRLIAYINRSTRPNFNFILNNKLIDPKEGSLYYFNSKLPHSVFSTVDNSIQLVCMLRFDHKLYELITESLSIY